MFGFSFRQPRTAAEWVARFHSGHWHSADERAFAAWLRQAPERRAEIELLSRLDALSADLLSSPGIRAELVDLRQASVAAQRRWAALPARRGILVAGLATVALGGVLVWPGADVYETEVGQSTMLNLPDGSTLWLNTNSRVRVQFHAEQRQVRLERGQAFFKVRSDPLRPFVVDAGRQRVVVTGTQFDVRREGADVAVAVIEGHVQVSPIDRSTAAPTSPKPVALNARQEAYFAAGAPPRLSEDRQIERRAAWREGRILLDNTSLAAALRDINRYSRTPLVLANAESAQLTITGEFKAGDVEGVIFALHELYGLRARREVTRIVLELPSS